MLVGRVLVPSLESERIPASVSARVIEGRLREEPGFSGSRHRRRHRAGEDPGEPPILGALAGCDLCLFSRPDDAGVAAAALERATTEGELPYIRVETSRRRFERFGPSRPAPRPARRFTAMLRIAARDIEEGISRLARRACASTRRARGLRFRPDHPLSLPPDDAPDASESAAVLSSIKAELPDAEISAFPPTPNRSTPSPGAFALIPGSLHRGGHPYLRRAFSSGSRRLGQACRGILASIPRHRDARSLRRRLLPEGRRARAPPMASPSSARERWPVSFRARRKARGGHPVEVIGLEV